MASMRWRLRTGDLHLERSDSGTDADWRWLRTGDRQRFGSRADASEELLLLVVASRGLKEKGYFEFCS